MNSDVQTLLEAINNQFARDVGGPIIQLADDVTNPYMLRRPTGILSIDLALKGGFPAGTLCQISAPEGVGKNALCNQTAGRVQEIYKKKSRIAWVCTEMSLDKMFAHMFGVAVPMSDFEIDMVNQARKDKSLPPLSKTEVEFRKRKVGDFIVVDQGTTAQRLEVALKLIESNKFQLIVIDSLASLLPDAADQTELQDEPQQSAEARLITRFCQKYWGRSGRAHDKEDSANWTTVLATYQVRANRSMAKFKKAWSVGGAYALRHAKAIDIQMENAGQYPKSGDKATLGKFVKWKLSKGKAGCHDGPRGEILYLHREGYDVYGDLVKVAQATNVLQQAGKYWKYVDEEGEKEKFSGGVQGVVNELVKNNELYWAVYRSVMRIAGIECVYKLQS